MSQHLRIPSVIISSERPGIDYPIINREVQQKLAKREKHEEQQRRLKQMLPKNTVISCTSVTGMMYVIRTGLNC